MATIKDVSQLANVSISTVSRVINNTAQVAPEKREAVLAAMKELSFRPNSFAQALVSKRSNCIGVLVGDLCGGPFFAQMMRGIESMVDKANKFTIVVSGNHDAARERHAIQALLQRRVVGTVACVVGLWLVVTLGMAINQVSVTAQRMALSQQEAKVESAEERVANYRGSIDEVAKDLERRQKMLESLSDQYLGEDRGIGRE